MRDLFLLVGIIATVVIPGMGQDAGDAGRIAIHKVIEDQQAAWNRRDLEGFMAGYWNSPELTFFSGAHESK
jgi:beta-aspartyl-peptidase (threonine type)